MSSVEVPSFLSSVSYRVFAQSSNEKPFLQIEWNYLGRGSKSAHIYRAVIWVSKYAGIAQDITQ